MAGPAAAPGRPGAVSGTRLGDGARTPGTFPIPPGLQGKKVDGAANAYAINVSQKRKYRWVPGPAAGQEEAVLEEVVQRGGGGAPRSLPLAPPLQSPAG